MQHIYCFYFDFRFLCLSLRLRVPAMITDEQIIKELQGREQSLLKQLLKVRAALSVYMNDDYKVDSPIQQSEVSESQEAKFDQYMSNDQRVIFAIRKINSGVIDNMVDALIKAGDETDRDKLHSLLTGSASRLYRKGLLKADKRGKKYKYYFDDSENSEKERAEILPL